MQKGSPSQELIERNKQIYEDKKTGKYSTIDLIKKYNITSQRLWQIVDREKKRRGEK